MGQQQMAAGADREEFRNALNERENDNVENRHDMAEMEYKTLIFYHHKGKYPHGLCDWRCRVH